MQARIRLSRWADAEIDDIQTFLLTQASPRTAQRMLDRIQSRIDGLAHNPRIGAPREELGQDRRILVIRPYVVIYPIEQEAAGELVLILHILHGARDIEALLAKD